MPGPDLLPSETPDFHDQGARIFAQALGNSALEAMRRAFDHVPSDRPGIRIADSADIAWALQSGGPVGSIAATLLGSGARPVRAILFDKTAATNWSLGWHQDRTIVVAEQVEVPGFSHWTVKAGLTQVEPPYCFLERMVTLRVHLDRVDAGNAPLAILPGSHRLGRLSETDIENLSRAAKPCVCLAEAGDVWAYGTPIIHASAASVRPKRRRVLQIDYSADALPRPLQWRGV